MTDPKTLAAGLSEAQRRAIRYAFQSSWGEWFVPTGTRHDVRRRLVEAGLLSKRPANPMRKAALAVRQHLQESAK